MRRRCARRAAPRLLAAALLLWSGGVAADPRAGRQQVRAAVASGVMPSAPALGPPATLLVGFRAADHAGFGRLVIDLPETAVASVLAVPGGLRVQFGPATPAIAGSVAPIVAFGAPPPLPRNAGPIVVDAGVVQLTADPGVSLRQSRLPGRLIVDFLDPVRALAPSPGMASPPPAAPKRPSPVPDPAAAASRATPTGPPPMGAAPTVAAPIVAAPTGPTPTGPAPTGPTPTGAPAGPPPAGAAQNDLAALTGAIAADAIRVGATPLPLPPAADSPPASTTMAALPIPTRSGVAALRRGDLGLLVVDADAPADVAAWRAVPGLAGADVASLPGATVVSFKLAPGATPMLRHGSDGWTFNISGLPAATEGIDLSTRPQHLLLATRGASRVISVADPLGGGTLLIGTLLADAPSASVQAARLLPPLALLQTWCGVAVEPLSDSLDMRPVATGFVIDLGLQRAIVGALPEGRSATAEAAGFARRFDLPPLPLAALINRRAAAAGAVSVALPRARATAQIRLAETMVALGLGAEAQAILHLGLASDGRLATDPEAVALGGVAALLAGRLAESAGLEDPLVVSDEAGADEIVLWRALRTVFIAIAAGEPAPAEAARSIAAKQAIVQAYPEPLRDRLLPSVAQALADGPAPQEAERLIAAAAEAPGLDYARALVDLRAGRTQQALDRLDRLARSADRNERARSAVQAIEVRLSVGQLGAAEAADRLDPLIAAWRGDNRELALRLRVAELRVQAGQLRASLVLLRNTLENATATQSAATQSPAPLLAAVRDRLAAVFAQTLAHDDASPMEPLEFVSLIEDNADLLPSGPQGELVARRVAERLDALDLPQRAEAALRRLVDTAPPGPARASLGSKLAAMQLRDGAPQAALVTLSASTSETLPASLVAERTLTYAQAAALQGDVEAATGALAALDTAAAGLLRAELLEKAGRWPEAAAVLSRRVERDVPPDGPIGKEAAALVLRLASAAAQAGQNDLLSQLRTDYLPRLPAGSGTDMVRILTESPIRAVSDLPRAAQEAALARSVAP